MVVFTPAACLLPACHAGCSYRMQALHSHALIRWLLLEMVNTAWHGSQQAAKLILRNPILGVNVVS